MDAAATLSGGGSSGGDDELRAALQTCVDARGLVAPAQEKLRALILSANTPTERAFREHQRDLVQLQIERAA